MPASTIPSACMSTAITAAVASMSMTSSSMTTEPAVDTIRAQTLINVYMSTGIQLETIMSMLTMPSYVSSSMAVSGWIITWTWISAAYRSIELRYELLCCERGMIDEGAILMQAKEAALAQVLRKLYTNP